MREQRVDLAPALEEVELVHAAGAVADGELPELLRVEGVSDVPELEPELLIVQHGILAAPLDADRQQVTGEGRRRDAPDDHVLGVRALTSPGGRDELGPAEIR